MTDRRDGQLQGKKNLLLCSSKSISIYQTVRIQQSVIYIFFWFFFVVRAEEDPEMTAEKPKFITKGQIFRVVIGDTARLPCQVDNLGKSCHGTATIHPLT